MKASIKKLREMIKDEKHGAREYRHYGYRTLARDEARHRRVLEKVLKKKLREK